MYVLKPSRLYLMKYLKSTSYFKQYNWTYMWDNLTSEYMVRASFMLVAATTPTTLSSEPVDLTLAPSTPSSWLLSSSAAAATTVAQFTCC